MLARRPAYLSAVLFAVAVSPALAQSHTPASSHLHPPTEPAASPYAGIETRSIKALSDQQIADLRGGRGMGLALAAELNGYPGPAHALELSDALQLSEEQKTQTAALMATMKAETVSLGERVISAEITVDRLFAERRVTEASLASAVAGAAAIQGELRAAHLRYHLAMVALLQPMQIAKYAELRGYTETSGAHAPK